MRSYEWGPELTEVLSLQEDTPESSLSLFPQAHKKEILWAHSKMVVAYKLKDALEWNLPVKHLDLGLCSIQNMRNNCLLFKQLSPWYFVTAAQVD